MPKGSHNPSYDEQQESKMRYDANNVHVSFDGQQVTTLKASSGMVIKSLTGGWAPKASAKGLACKAPDDRMLFLEADGAKAVAVAAKVERAMAVFILRTTGFC
jgi:hypothetical protein